MTRKEQIEKAMEEWITESGGSHFHKYAFKDGAEWADANPIIYSPKIEITKEELLRAYPPLKYSKLESMLAIAEEALSLLVSSEPTNEHGEFDYVNQNSFWKAKLALATLADMRKELK